MKKIICTICLILCCGCHSTDNRTMTPDAERYYKGLKILFQAGNPISRDALAEIEYQKRLMEEPSDDEKVFSDECDRIIQEAISSLKTINQKKGR